MAYDEALAERLRAELADEPGLTEKKMFGGLAFLLDGHMTVCASSHGGILLRVDPEQRDALLDRPHTDRFVMTDREMAGWLYVRPDGIATDADLQDWVARGVARARALPPK